MRSNLKSSIELQTKESTDKLNYKVAATIKSKVVTNLIRVSHSVQPNSFCATTTTFTTNLNRQTDWMDKDIQYTWIL